MEKDSKQVIPLFPLPSTVFYPGTPLPLHIFEPRYRQMTADALEGERKIGMVLLKPDWEAAYFDRPEIFPMGCVGSIEKEIRYPERPGACRARSPGFRRSSHSSVRDRGAYRRGPSALECYEVLHRGR